MSTDLSVAIFGATGTAGSAVLRACVTDSRFARVVAVTRRALNVDASKLQEVLCRDFLDMEPIGEQLADHNVCFYCLGVSQARVRDPARYREITLDYTLAAARVLKTRSPLCTLHFLSGVGTDPSGRSRMMWARVKGEAEKALQEVGLAGVVCWRPGWIHPLHPGEGGGMTRQMSRVLYPLLRGFPGMAVSSVEYGRAMLQAALEEVRHGVLHNRDIRALADRYQ
jgi:uncharacterized protein YbjT (DUF2867 family)